MKNSKKTLNLYETTVKLKHQVQNYERNYLKQNEAVDDHWETLKLIIFIVDLEYKKTIYDETYYRVHEHY